MRDVNRSFEKSSSFLMNPLTRFSVPFPVAFHLYVFSDGLGALSRILVHLAVGHGPLS